MRNIRDFHHNRYEQKKNQKFNERTELLNRCRKFHNELLKRVNATPSPHINRENEKFENLLCVRFKAEREREGESTRVAINVS